MTKEFIIKNALEMSNKMTQDKIFWCVILWFISVCLYLAFTETSKEYPASRSIFTDSFFQQNNGGVE